MKKKDLLGINEKATFLTTDEAVDYGDKVLSLKVDIASQKKLESSLILGLVGNSSLIGYANKILKDTDFIGNENREAYRCILDMYRNNMVIDYETIYVFAKNKYKIDTFISNAVLNKQSLVISKQNVLFLKESYIKLMAKVYFLKAYELAFSNEWKSDVFTQASNLISILESIQSINDVPVDTLHDAALKIAVEEERDMNANTFSGTSTEFKTLDYRTGGFMNTDLILIAARPGMGKTAFIVSMFKKKLNQRRPFLFISIEMSLKQILRRIFSQEEGIDLNRITAGKLTKEEKDKFIEFCATMPNNCHFVENISDISQIEALSEKLVNIGCKEIYIDYLQLITGADGDSTNDRTGNISSRLKRLAKRLDVPIIALSQLSRPPKPNFKTGKYTISDLRPELTDLRDSGSLEQDADQVYFLLRPEYYRDKLEKFKDEWENQIQVICAKFRSGSPFTQTMTWKPLLAKVEDNYNTISEIENKEIFKHNEKQHDTEFKEPDF